MPYVITCGDEGVQINEGTRLGIVGAGIGVEHFSEIVEALKEVLADDKITIAASGENDWVKSALTLDTFEQADATMQQQIQAIADDNQLLYTGFLPFADPKDLEHGIRGHMVRPKGIHIANKVCFTIAGGEQTYNLGQYLISAEWVSQVDKEIAQRVLRTQVEFYSKLAKQDLEVILEEEGMLDSDIVSANKQTLRECGYSA